MYFRPHIFVKHRIQKLYVEFSLKNAPNLSLRGIIVLHSSCVPRDNQTFPSAVFPISLLSFFSPRHVGGCSFYIYKSFSTCQAGSEVRQRYCLVREFVIRTQRLNREFRFRWSATSSEPYIFSD